MEKCGKVHQNGWKNVKTYLIFAGILCKRIFTSRKYYVFEKKGQ